MYLINRPRRIRSSRVLRDLCAETVLSSNKFIMPYFILEGSNKREPIDSMPGISRVSLDNALKDIETDHKTGIKSILLFGIPDRKDDHGTGAYASNGIIQKALHAIKKMFPDIVIITDICLCEYTDHGHCGLIDNGTVDNDSTLKLLSKIAVSHADAGADIVAPSDMMDGRVAAIREALDGNGFHNTPIMSYASKYSSAFYGPFRDAAGSTPQFGDRKTYQMDNRNSREALKEVFLDIDEGADIVMVKPALSYLDIITTVRQHITVPLCAYNVSGEYSMVKVMAEKGFADEQNMVTEIVTSIFRAGADMVISYHTRDIIRNNWLA